MQRFARTLYRLCLIGLVIDMGGAFGVKYVVFFVAAVSVILFTMTRESIAIPRNVILIEGSIFGMLPFLLFGLSITILGVPVTDALSQLSSFATWMLLPVVMQVSPKEAIINDYTRAMLYAAWIIIVTFFSIWLLLSIGKNDVVSSINQFANQYRVGYIGVWPLGLAYGKIIPNVYFRWTLLLLPAIVISLKHSYKEIAILISAAILSLSTGMIFFSFIAVLWAILASLTRRKRLTPLMRRAFVVLIIFAMIFIISWMAGYSGVILKVFSKLQLVNPSSESTRVKLEHATSILTLIKGNASIFLFGMGLGSKFYSTGSNSVVTNVEVSHLNLIRQFGILYTILFFGYVFLLFIKLCKTDEQGRMLAIGIVGLFLAAGTNPLLISPVFFLILIISRAYIYSEAKERALKEV